MIVQVAGRAGRSDLPGWVVVQTLHPDEPAIRFAVGHDFDGFADWELPLRRQASLPPFSRMVRLLIRHRRSEKAEEGAKAVNKILKRLLPPGQVTIFGPQPAGVAKIRGQFRFQILLLAQKPGLIQNVLRDGMESISRQTSAEVVADVDPVHLL